MTAAPQPGAAPGLLEVADRCAHALEAEGFETIAVTGSVARGDAGVGSDVDLWVIGAADEVLQQEVCGVPVTIMIETWEKASSFAQLARSEPHLARVLRDPSGRFAALRSLHASQLEAIQRHNIESSERAIWDLLARSHTGKVATRLDHLRAAAWTMVCLDLYERTGRIAPKYRHAQADLPERAIHHLEAILGLAECRGAWGDIAPLLRLVAREAAACLETHLGRAFDVPHPTDVECLAQAGRLDEALHRARAYFDEIVREPLEKGLELQDFGDFALAKLNGPLLALWLGLNGFAGAPERLEAELARARSELQALCDVLGRG